MSSTKILAVATGLVTALSLMFGASAASASTRPCTYELKANALAAYCSPGLSTFWIMRGGPDLYTTGTHWTYRGNTETATGTLYGVDVRKADLGRVTLVFSHVFGPNMKTSRNWYGNLHIIGGKDVGHYWSFHFSTAAEAGGWNPS
jgi:hypothetical protein